MTHLWEILVPRAFNDGAEVPLVHHKAWDEKVRKITHGLTILKPAKGIWESPTGTLFEEGMIPVRIACTKEQIREILAFTIVHYDQLAGMAYHISNDVIIMHRTDTDTAAT